MQDILGKQVYGRFDYGTNHSSYTSIRDVQCNVYDMASNCFEWTTETNSYQDICCTARGDSWEELDEGYESQRNVLNQTNPTDKYTNISFRPILYILNF